MQILTRNKEGSLAIEIVIGIMIFLVAISFFVDIFMLTWQINEMGTYTTYVANTAARQGGINRTLPRGWSTNVNGEYRFQNNIHNTISNLMDSVNIEEWVVRVRNPSTGQTKTISSNTSSGDNSHLMAGYGEVLIVTIEYRVSLDNISNMLPSVDASWTMSTSRSVLSEFKERFDGFIR